MKNLQSNLGDQMLRLTRKLEKRGKRAVVARIRREVVHINIARPFTDSVLFSFNAIYFEHDSIRSLSQV